jgi:hypothetical protein
VSATHVVSASRGSSSSAISHWLPLVAWVALWGTWTTATWWFEGRIETLLRPGAVMDRLAYVVVANGLVGVLGASLLVRWVKGRRGGRDDVPVWRRTLAVAAGLALGLTLLLTRGPAAARGWVLVNAYAQVLTVTVAEVAVCWWALAEVLRMGEGERPWRRAILVVLVAAPAFGLYHFGHSPPFDTWAMVGGLTVVGLVTGTFYVLSDDLFATVVAHNFAGTLGVTQALERADRLASYEQPMVVTVVGGVAALLVLGAAYRLGRPPGADQADFS